MAPGFERGRAGSCPASFPPLCPGGNSSAGREVPGLAWPGGGRMEARTENGRSTRRPMLASSWDATRGALAQSLHVTGDDLGVRDSDPEELLAPPVPGCAWPAETGVAARRQPRSWGSREGRQGPRRERVWARSPGAELLAGLCGEQGRRRRGARPGWREGGSAGRRRPRPVRACRARGPGGRGPGNGVANASACVCAVCS